MLFPSQARIPGGQRVNQQHNQDSLGDGSCRMTSHRRKAGGVLNRQQSQGSVDASSAAQTLENANDGNAATRVNFLKITQFSLFYLLVRRRAEKPFRGDKPLSGLQVGSKANAMRAKTEEPGESSFSMISFVKWQLRWHFPLGDTTCTT